MCLNVCDKKSQGQPELKEEKVVCNVYVKKRKETKEKTRQNMEFSADPFSSNEISQSCWSMCRNEQVISHELLPSLLPIYRDDETRSDYELVANFFYCMDACDTRYMVKRMTLALPIVALGKY